MYDLENDSLEFTPSPELAETIRAAAIAERDHRNASEVPRRRRRRADPAADAAAVASFTLGLLP